jgi:pentatricopeptide repeat protein
MRFAIRIIKQPARLNHKPKLEPRWVLLHTNANAYMYSSLLNSCTHIKTLQKLHAHILLTGLDQNIFLGTKIVGLYSLLGRLDNARQVFDKICQRNIFLWNAIIRGYSRNGFFEETLALYCQMQQEGVWPDRFTFPFALKACAGLSALQEGKDIHYHIGRMGFESDVAVGVALINMYAKCGRLEYARQVFDKMCERDAASWNAMIVGYLQNGVAEEALEIFRQMQLTDVKANLVTMVSVLPVCAELGALQSGRAIHGYIIRGGFETYISVGSSLVAMYGKCGFIDIADKVFHSMAERDVVSWNAMIAGYAQNELPIEALALFDQMQLEDLKPDRITMLSVLPACTHLGSLQQAQRMHGYIIRRGFELDVAVGNSFIAMYAKCGSLDNGCQVFDKITRKDVVSWTAMIAGYVHNEHFHEALELFHKMQVADLIPDSVTMVSVLSACAHLGALQQGKWIHDYITRNGYDSDVSVRNALVAMYAKCGNTEMAWQLFYEMHIRDTGSWNAMITCSAQNGHSMEALTLFLQMQLSGLKPNSVTLGGVLSACANIGALQHGKGIHNFIIKCGFESDISVGTALFDMYAKCGNVKVAHELFDRMPKRDVVSWSAMIGGYGMHGYGKNALELFSRMQETSVIPNHATFVSVLSACSHAGLVDEGWRYFDYMTQKYCITPNVKHYACMVDLLGRAGHLHDALEFIEKMPIKPDVGVWGALLGACKIHGNIELGEHVAACILHLEPENTGHYILLSNTYAATGRWDDVEKLRKTMKGRCLKKTPGCSFIEVNNKVHGFLAEDR